MDETELVAWHSFKERVKDIWESTKYSSERVQWKA